jgi:hypothetical protein
MRLRNILFGFPEKLQTLYHRDLLQVEDKKYMLWKFDAAIISLLNT